MAFKIKLVLPSKRNTILVNELNYKLYRDLVKGLHEADSNNIVIQTNLILKEVLTNIDIEQLTLEDKLYILLQIREICVNPDLKLKGTCEVSGKPFDWATEIKTITEKIKSFNYNFKEKNVEGTFGGMLVADELFYLKEPECLFTELIARLKALRINEEDIDLKVNFNERKAILEILPGFILKKLTKHLETYLKELNKTILLEVKSPFTEEVILCYTGQLNTNIVNEFVKYLFLENLNNVYKSFYNIVKHCQFNPQYLDSITPAEIQVYWSYFVEELAENNKPRASSPLKLPTQNSELGFN